MNPVDGYLHPKNKDADGEGVGVFGAFEERTSYSL